MEYAIGLSITAICSVIAMWVNDHFNVGGELEEQHQA